MPTRHKVALWILVIVLSATVPALIYTYVHAFNRTKSHMKAILAVEYAPFYWMD